jgi:glycosyltransferase involved in cell wall biosynthesis
MGRFASPPGSGREAPSRRALHVIQTAGLGGSESIFAALTEALGAGGWDIVCATGEEGWLVERLRGGGFAVEILPGLGQGRVLEMGSVLALRRLILMHDVGLVHALSFPAHLYACLAARLTGRRAIANVRNAHHDTAGARRRAAWRGGIAPSADAVVTVSERLAEEMRRLVGGRKVVCLPNGIEVERFAAGDREGARAALGLAPEALVVGAVGNTRPVKGHMDLLRAAATVMARVPAATVVLVGAEVEPVASELRQFCRARGLEGRVVFTGLRRDVEALLPAMDIFCLPSLSEGMSGALLQAMAAGRPVVATAVGGNPEVVVEGETGLLVPVRDPEALARALLALAEAPALRARMGAAGQQRVRERYSLQTMIARYDALYRAVLARRPLAAGRPAPAERVP